VVNSSFPILSLLILLPLAGGFLLFGLSNERQARRFALLVALLELLLTGLLSFHFQSATADMQFVERREWIPTLNIQYLLGVDGISVLFLPLTALINLCVIAASTTRIHTLPRLYFALLLWLESATVGVFAALDLGLFFMFWELTLPPLYLLLSLWGGGPQRRHAAMKYTLFMLAGGVPLLLGCVLLALNNARETAMPAPAGLSFDYFALLEAPIPLPVQSAIFLLLLLGFAVKAPLFPFHVWLPATALQGPAGITALLTGLKLGLYGIIRFAVPLAPQATQHYSGLLASWGVFSALYGALLALRQTDLRRMLAYSSISHVGLVLVGIAAITIQGIQGAVFQLFNFGVIAGGIFLLAGFLQQRMGSTDVAALGGAARSMPLLAGLFFVLGLAGIGVPGTNGFAASQLIVIGAFKAHIGAGLATLMTAILGAAYFLKAFRAAFLGPATRREVMEAVDLRPLELCVAATLVSLALGFGVFPQAVLNCSQRPLQAWIARLETGNLPTLALAGGKPEPRAAK
jgi:NADH-quinone oxidoreductase subunit M